VSRTTHLSCPINSAVAAIADKWKILLILMLQTRTWRFGELLNAIDGIAPKVMVRQLRSLEADGLVVRTAYAEVPPRVEYALSESGRSLLPILNDLQGWVIANSAQLSKNVTGDNPEAYANPGAQAQFERELEERARAPRARKKIAS